MNIYWDYSNYNKNDEYHCYYLFINLDNLTLDKKLNDLTKKCYIKNGWKLYSKPIFAMTMFETIDYFDAENVKYGKVSGSYNKIIYAENNESFNNFRKTFPFEEFNTFSL